MSMSKYLLYWKNYVPLNSNIMYYWIPLIWLKFWHGNQIWNFRSLVKCMYNFSEILMQSDIGIRSPYRTKHIWLMPHLSRAKLLIWSTQRIVKHVIMWERLYMPMITYQSLVVSYSVNSLSSTKVVWIIEFCRL